MKSTRSKAPKIHVASRGEFASDAAVRERRVEVVIVNKHGQRESYGQLVQRRHVGGYLVELTDDAVRGMWWVIAVRDTPPRSVFLGFRRRRRADARLLFDHATEDELDQGLD